MSDIKKRLENISQIQKTLSQEIGEVFVFEALDKLKNMNIAEKTPFAFIYSNTLDSLFLQLADKRISYSAQSNIPLYYLGQIFRYNYEALYTREGMTDLVETIAPTLKDSPEVQHFLDSVFAPAKQAQLNSHDKLALRLFNLDNQKDTFYFEPEDAKKLVNNIFKEGFDPKLVSLGNTHNPYSWLLDLAGSAFIRLASETSEGYPSWSPIENNAKYLYVANEVFKHLDFNIALTDFETMNVPVAITSKNEASKIFLPHECVLEYFLNSDMINFNYGPLDKTRFVDTFKTIFTHIDIPSEKAVHCLKRLFTGYQAQQTIEYFTVGYHSEKGDEYFKTILNTLFKDNVNEADTLNLDTKALSEIQDKLPESYQFMVEHGVLPKPKAKKKMK